MPVSTEHQIIHASDGSPLYVLVPWEEYVARFGGCSDKDVTIPHDTAPLHGEHGKSCIRVWREHLGLSQHVVARRMEISQPAYAKIEALDAELQLETFRKIAVALGVEWEQIRPVGL